MDSFPSEDTLRDTTSVIPRLTGSSILFKNLEFWSKFQRNHRTIAITLFLLGILIPVLICDRLDGYLLWASIMSSICLICVMWSFVQVPQWRRHPSPLIFYKSFADLLFSIVLILNTFGVGEGTTDRSCTTFSGITQFCLITSECWLVSMGSDLIKFSLCQIFFDFFLLMTIFQFFLYMLGPSPTHSLVIRTI